MSDRVEKQIEMNAGKAVSELERLTRKLSGVVGVLSQVERGVKVLDFKPFIPAIEEFADKFNKINIPKENLSNIQVMAQALNRFKMTAVELNKEDFEVSFSKITQGIYAFNNSISRIDTLGSNITNISELGRALNRFKMTASELNQKDFNVSFEKITRAIYSFSSSVSRMSGLINVVSLISELGLAINRLVSASVKLQNTKVSFSSLTQAIYAFVGSIFRIKRSR